MENKWHRYFPMILEIGFSPCDAYCIIQDGNNI